MEITMKIKTAVVNEQETVLLVPSNKTTGAYFVVKRKWIKKTEEHKWTCSCPAWIFSQAPKEDCKHLEEGKQYIKDNALTLNKKALKKMATALVVEDL